MSKDLDDMAMAYLEVSPADWQTLVKNNVAGNLAPLVAMSVDYLDRVEEGRKFFLEINELEVAPLLDSHLSLLDQAQKNVTALVQTDFLTPDEMRSQLATAYNSMQVAYTKYAKMESSIINLIRAHSGRDMPKTAFLAAVRPYWNHIDDFWTSKREQVLGIIKEYVEGATPQLKKAAEALELNLASPHEVLYQVEKLLKNRRADLAAHRVAESRDKIKNYVVEEAGLIPAYVGAKGNWKVEADDCPDHSMPERTTKLTENFAFCRWENKECQALSGIQGSYVKCKAWVRLKEGNWVGNIQEMGNKSMREKLAELAETDPFIRQLLTESDRRGGKLYVGKVTDDRLSVMLEQYPKSKRKGNFTYDVYLVANEPVFISKNLVVAADKILLETLSEGTEMPRHASTVRVAGPMMRITFTANALRDPEFRDFLSKKKAVKSGSWQYDIPFEREEDLKFILNEIRDEFGYKIEIFEILDDVDISVDKDFGIRSFKDLPLSKFSAVNGPARLMFTYIRPSNEMSAHRATASLETSEKLIDIANLLPADSPLKERVANLADRLRVGRSYLIASSDDVIRYADGAVGLIPEVGTRWQEKDPDTGDSSMVELVRVDKKAKRGPHYVVKALDSGKEFTIKRPWIRPFEKDACEHMAPPPPMMDGGNLPLPPPPSMMGDGLAHFDTGNGFYIFQLPSGDMMPEAPPPGFGRFPGDAAPAPAPVAPAPAAHPVLRFMPRMGPPPAPVPMDMAPPVDSPCGGPGPLPAPEEVMPPLAPSVDLPDSAQGPAPAAVVEEGPRVDSTKTYVPKEEQKSKTKIKFTPVDPDVDDVLAQLQDMFKGDPRVKDMRTSMGEDGAPVIHVHATTPKSMRDEVPEKIDGVEVRLSPFHESESSDEVDAEDKEASDNLVSPMSNRPQNGHPTIEDRPPGPYLDQVSGPPPVMWDPLLEQTRDITKS